MSQNKAYIRVDLREDGKTPVRELVVDGRVICELSFVETIELAMQASSSLRYEEHHVPPRKPAAR